MQLIEAEGAFHALTTYEERDIPRAAGFRWNAAVKRWTTRDATTAARLAPFADAELQAKLAQLAGAAREQEQAAVAASWATDSDLAIPAPEGLAYLPYQRAGIAFGMARPNVLIGDDMGLGKTIQAIGIANSDPSVQLALVVAPASLKLNWRREIQKWDVSRGRVMILNGSKGFTEKERKGFQCLRALDAEIRRKGGEARDNVSFRVHVPPELRFPAKSGDRPPVREAPMSGEPIHDRPVGVVDANRPACVSSPGRAETSFPINEPRHVSLSGDGCGRREWGRGALLVNADAESVAELPKVANPNAEISADGCVSFASVQPSDCGTDLGDSKAGAPVAILPAHFGGLPGKAHLLDFALQGVVVASDFFGCLAECDLPTLYALRNILRSRFRNNEALHSDLRWMVINYDILNAWKASIDGLGPLDMLIVDEAHALKNPKAQRTLACLGGRRVIKARPQTKAAIATLAAKHPEAKVTASGVEIRTTPIRARRRVFMTGTPILNKPVELWPLVESLDPAGLGANFMRFAMRYCGARQNSHGWDFSGASHLDELQRALRASIMVRRLKADVLTELPPKRRTVLEFSADGASSAVAVEMAAYERLESGILRAEAQVALAEAEGDEAAYQRAVAALKAAKAAAFTDMSRVRHETALKKVPFCIEHIEAALESSGKLVVFAYHADVIAQIAAHFGRACVTITGQTAQADRQAAVDRFQTDPTCTLFLGNIIAAGVGLTLTASSHVIFCELDWRPGIVTQAEDRTHRIGQRNSVLVEHLVFEGSVDAQMARTILAKQAVIDQALDTGADVPAADDFDLDAVVARVEAPKAAVDLAAKEPTSEEAKRRAKAEKMAREAATITADQIAAVQEAIRTLAAMDADHAREMNGMGFSKLDTFLGSELARLPVLTPRQAVLGRKIARKYHRQIGAAVVAAMGVAA